MDKFMEEKQEKCLEIVYNCNFKQFFKKLN